MADIIKFFEYEHLTESRMREVSSSCCVLAQYMDNHLDEGAEKSAGLRKLLEAKDCFVRSALESSRRFK